MTTTQREASPARRESTGVPFEVSAAQVGDWLAQGSCVLVDVREPDEFARERIAGAESMPLSSFSAARAMSAGGPGRVVVFHCKGGKRSAEAVRLATHASPAPALSLAGGIEAWKAAGLPVIGVGTGMPGAAGAGMDGGGRRGTRLSVMRQVQLVIGGLLLAGSALAWLVDPRFVLLPALLGAGLTYAGASGTCALASLLAKMPWNRVGTGGCGVPTTGGQAGPGGSGSCCVR